MASRFLDNPQTTLKRIRTIKTKPFLTAFYEDAYAFFRSASENTNKFSNGKKLEIGSGGGFLKDSIPDVITSDYLDIGSVDLPKCSALDLPFADGELCAVFLLDVLHHLPDLDAFFAELTRVLRPGGIAAMVEPANTFLARFIYQNFHHEAFDAAAPDWKLPRGGGPLSSANIALPWIALVRDHKRFEQCFSRLKIVSLEPFGPLLYPLSGGVSCERQFLPSFFLPGIRVMECMLSPLSPWLGMFYRIVLNRAG